MKQVCFQPNYQCQNSTWQLPTYTPLASYSEIAGISVIKDVGPTNKNLSKVIQVLVWYQKIEWWTAYITGKLTSECTQNVYIEIVLLPLWILLSERGCASQVTFTFTIIIERNTKQHAHSMYTHSLEEIHPRTSVVCMPLPCWLVQWSGSLCGVVLNSRDDLWLVSSHHCCTGGCGRRRWDVNKERAHGGRGVG